MDRDDRTSNENKEKYLLLSSEYSSMHLYLNVDCRNLLSKYFLNFPILFVCKEYCKEDIAYLKRDRDIKIQLLIHHQIIQVLHYEQRKL